MAWFTTPMCAVILNRVIPIQYSNSCKVRNEDKAGLDVASLYFCITILKSKEKNCKFKKKNKNKIQDFYYVIINQSFFE